MSRWVRRSLDSLGTVITGSTPKASNEDPYGGHVPFVTPGDLGSFSPIDHASRTLSESGVREARLIPEGAVLVCCIGATLGKVGIAGREIASNQQINSVVFDHEIIRPRFGFYACRLLRSKLQSMAPATTLPIVSKSKFGQLEIPVPPLVEQERFAKILDKTELLRAKRREALSHLGELATSIFSDMFGDPTTNSKSWPASTIGRIAEKVTDGEHLTPRRAAEGVKLLSARNIRDGYIDFTNVDFIEVEEHDRIKRRCDPSLGDVLISCSGTIGRVASVSTLEPFSLVRSVAMIRPNERLVRTKFLEYYLRTPALKARMLQRANASSQANLFQNQIRELPFFVPSMELQQEFVRLIEAVENLKVSHNDHLTELDALFESLQYRAFRGEL